VLALIVLFGWISGRWDILRLHDDDPPMAPATALAFLALAVEWLWRDRLPRDSPWSRRLAASAGLAVAIGCASQLGRIAFSGLATTPVGVMSPITAAALLVASVVPLLAALRRSPAVYLQVMVLASVPIAFLGLVVVLSFALGVPLPFGNPWPVASSTGLALILMGLAYFMAATAEAYRRFAERISPRLQARRGKRLAIVLALACIAILLTIPCFYFWRAEYRQTRQDARAALSGVTEIKSQQIALWFRERASLTERIRQAPPPASIRDWAVSLRDSYQLSAVAIGDADGRILARFPQTSEAFDHRDAPLMARAVRERTVVFEDLHPGPDGREHMTWFVPIGSSAAHPAEVPAVVVLITDPDHYPFPELSTGFQFHTAVAMLVRRTGEGVLVVRGPRSSKTGRRADERQAPASIPGAVSAAEGVTELLDDRGIPVLAAVRDVVGTPWRLVVAIDRAEVHFAARRQIWLWSAVGGGLVIALMLAVGLSWYSRELSNLAALHEEQQLVQTILDHSPIGFALNRTDDGSVRYVSRRFAEVYGIPRGTVTNIRDFFDRAYPSAAEVVRSRVMADIASGDSSRLHWDRIRFTTSAGDERIISASAVFVPEQPLMMSTVEDVTASVAAEQLVHTLSTAVEQSPASILITDLNGTITYVNAAFTKVTGYSAAEAIGQNPRILKSGQFSVQDYKRMWDTLASGGTWSGEIQNRRKDGTLFWETSTVSPLRDDTGRPTGYLAVKEDITERKRAELERNQLQAQLMQAQKMESVGRLAGGVAHDFNNMLAVIMGHAQMAIEALPAGDPIQADLEAVLQAGQRSADLTRQLLAFARKQNAKPRVIDLNERVGGTLSMLGRMMGENIKVIWEPASTPWPVKIDPTQLDQILANLAVNARDAIVDRGTLSISTANVTICPADVRRNPKLRPGKFVCLSVTDTGCGMPPEVLSRLFEPFFTTKAIGKGTGLGTATVFGIVAQNLGIIDVQSRVGVGTTFRIYLPVSASAGQATEDENTSVPRGTETVLVVEDEESVLQLTARVLERLGYSVISCHSAVEALAAMDGPGPSVDLVLADVVMPDTNGKALVDELRKKRPGLHALFMSGHTADIIEPHGVLNDGIHFIPKPFLTAQLAQQVRIALA
jgi:PAS domain S-box-containing protein